LIIICQGELEDIKHIILKIRAVDLIVWCDGATEIFNQKKIWNDNFIVNAGAPDTYYGLARFVFKDNLQYFFLNKLYNYKKNQ